MRGVAGEYALGAMSRDETTQGGDEERAFESPTSVGDEGVGGAGALETPDRIGAYQILSVLGEGGFGVVYLAEQHEPVRRRVALKVIKPGMDSAQVIARFEAERQALALMDHPSVARVLDVGTTERGLPYFVMEHVAGVPITDYCVRGGLGIEEVLRLFMDVCGAVQHAHQKGVMHRDIKPSNVLVEYVDGRAVAKVIDFGVAKALTEPLTPEPAHTRMGQFIGTPEYMSPEQAEGSLLDVDTRSDVYSLGVVLYELLAGDLPFDGDRLRASVQSEIVRTLREEEAPRPSVRVRARAEASKDPATRARLRARSSRLRGDLDWIVMKCLEKDRSRRYGTPNGLSADIGRSLRNEPVVAGPPSTVYRMRKFVSRNRAPVVAAAMVLGVLVLGMIGTSLGFVRAERARQAEAHQRRTAESTLNFLFESFVAEISPDEMGGDVTMREVIEASMPRIGEYFAGSPEAEAGVRMRFGEMYLELGAYPEALDQFRRSYALRVASRGEVDPESLEARDGVCNALLRMRRYDDAEPEVIATLEGRRRILGEGHEDTLGTMSKLVALRYFQGRLDEAESISRSMLETRARVSGEGHEETIRAASSLAELLRRRQKYEEAETLLVRTLERSRETLGERASITLMVMNNLGGLHQSRGDDEKAIAVLGEALRLRRDVLLDDHPLTIATLINLSNAQEAAGHREEAVRTMVDVLTNARARGASSRNARRAMRLLALLLLEMDRNEEAVEWATTAVEACRDAGVEQTLEGADAYRILGGGQRAVSDAAGSITSYTRAYSIALAAAGPKHALAVESANALAGLHEDAGRVALGREWRTRASEEELATDAP